MLVATIRKDMPGAMSKRPIRVHSIREEPAEDRRGRDPRHSSTATAAVEGERARRLVERVVRIRELGIVAGALRC